MIDIVHIGLGPLGQMMVRSAVGRGSFRIVGAVDTDPAKIGKDLGEFCGHRASRRSHQRQPRRGDPGQVAAGGRGHDRQQPGGLRAAGGPACQGEAPDRLDVRRAFLSLANPAGTGRDESTSSAATAASPASARASIPAT